MENSLTLTQSNPLDGQAAAMAALQGEAMTYLLAKREQEIDDVIADLNIKLNTKTEEKAAVYKELAEHYRDTVDREYRSDIRRMVRYIKQNFHFCAPSWFEEELKEAQVTLTFERDEETGVMQACASEGNTWGGGMSGLCLTVESENGQEENACYKVTYDIEADTPETFRLAKKYFELSDACKDVQIRYNDAYQMKRDLDKDEKKIRAEFAGNLLKQAGIDMDKIQLTALQAPSSLLLEDNK